MLPIILVPKINVFKYGMQNVACSNPIQTTVTDRNALSLSHAHMPVMILELTNQTEPRREPIVTNVKF